MVSRELTLVVGTELPQDPAQLQQLFPGVENVTLLVSFSNPDPDLEI